MQRIVHTGIVLLFVYMILESYSQIRCALTRIWLVEKGVFRVRTEVLMHELAHRAPKTVISGFEQNIH